MSEKIIIGMVHLKPLPTSPLNEYSINEIINYAKKDLKNLEKAGINYAIIENVFDLPYPIEMDLELIVTYTHIFTVLQQTTDINLGVNIHATSGVEEMVVASICGAQFIRAESFVEYRNTMSGILKPMAANLMRTRKKFNSDVRVFADVNVKESRPIYEQSIQESIDDAITAQADAIIVTGFMTGQPPTPSEVKSIKEHIPNELLFIGSGVNSDNIAELLEHADGVIVGSSIKEDSDINKPVSLERAKKLLENINKK